VQSALSLVELIYRLRQQGQIPEEALSELRKRNADLEELEALSSWQPEDN
jgi:hypothetical protein